MKKNKVSVLVTGANGQLGCCIKDLEPLYPELNFIFSTHQDLDITDQHAVASYFKDNTIDYCINCAAYTAVDKAEAEKEQAFKINANGSKNLALACKEHGVVLIHISTDFVFDGNKTEPYTEDDKPNPINVYGASKLQGEIEIQNILKTYFIIRTSWLYSEHGHNFLKSMLRLAETKDEINVVSDQTGTPTYAGDLAEVILHFITAQCQDYGVFHYSNEGAVSWCDFAKTIFELSDKTIKVNPITTKDFPATANRPLFSVLSKERAQRKCGISISDWKVSLKLALNRFASK